MARQVPSSEVLAAFGLDERDLAPISWGQERCWRADDLILKPADNVEEAD